jgi:hypothetical protein
MLCSKTSGSGTQLSIDCRGKTAAASTRPLGLCEGNVIIGQVVISVPSCFAL